MKTEITLENVQTFLRAVEGNTIKSIVELHEQKSATQYHGMISLLLAIASFKIYRFCSRIARQILSENGMPEERVNCFLDFEKYLGEKG
jgi:hypothetical protein